MDITPTMAELEAAVTRADAALAQASAEERGLAEAEVLASRVEVARRWVMDSAPNNWEGVRLALGVSEWLKVYGVVMGPAAVDALSFTLRGPSKGGKAASRAFA
ncbi:MAG: hypothetical protein WKF96_13750 [Solirubrobacteraceae bacterium]